MSLGTVTNIVRCAFVGSLLALPEVGFAQTTTAEPNVDVQVLFAEADRLMTAGDFEAACPKFEEVTRRAPEGIGAKKALGECYAGLGRYASAWDQYSLAESMALGRTDPRAKHHAEEARNRMNELGPRISRVTIVVPTSIQTIPEVVATWDGIALDTAMQRIVKMVDKGPHLLEVKAPGRHTSRQNVDVTADGSYTTVTAEEPKLIVLANPGNKKAESSADARSAKPIPLKKGNPWMRPLGIAFLGAGGAGLVAGSIFGGLAKSKWDQSNLDSLCMTYDACTAGGVALRNQAFTLATGSTIAFATGGVLLGLGTVFVAVGSRKTGAVEQVSNAPKVSFVVSPSGLVLGGTW